MTQATQERKKSFSSFTYKEAFKQLGVSELQRWSISAKPVPISDFFSFNGKNPRPETSCF